MKCTHCGKKQGKNLKFCGDYGEPLPVSVSEKKGNRLMPFFLGAGSMLLVCIVLFEMFLVSPFHVKKTGQDDNGFDSPEAAVEAYFTGLRNSDLDAMVNTFAISHYVENVDLEALINRSSSYAPSMSPILPSSNDLFFGLNIERQRSKIANSILRQIWILGDLPFESSYTITVVSSKEYESEYNAEDIVNILAESYNSDALLEISDLEFKSIDDLTDGSYSDDRNQKNIALMCQLFGANKMESVAAEFKYKGKEFLFCCDVAQYDGRWYMLELGGCATVIMSMGSSNGGIRAN